MTTDELLVQQSTAFVEYLEAWSRTLRPFSLQDEVQQPERAAVFSADMVVGFCRQGNLASPRIAGLIPSVVDLFQRAHAHGIRHFVLVQDTHNQDAPEFHSFPPHCIRGTAESQTIPELQSLPFSSEFTVVEKNSLHPSIGTGLEQWLEQYPELCDLMVVGDCTDLCTYSLAMHLRLRANAYGLKEQRVVVPANAVDTYDMPIDTAREVGAMAHPGDLFHRLFLYHMALNGVQVVRAIT
ncbi:isochorismatase family protein [Chloroflexota bacterium]